MTELSTQQPSQQRLVVSARALALSLLDDNLERRRHTAGVAARASLLRDAVPEGVAELLVAAAWVHDIGYAAAVRDTGFHPLDGARFLRSAGWDPTLCWLVAHHSGSRYVAAEQRLDEALGEFVFEENPLSDALTVADQTVGPHGRPMSLEERMAEMLQRRGPRSPQARAHARREVYLRSAFDRVNRRLLTPGDESESNPAPSGPEPQRLAIVR